MFPEIDPKGMKRKNKFPAICKFAGFPLKKQFTSRRVFHNHKKASNGDLCIYKNVTGRQTLNA